jgi:3-hydroxymyristoyl/3-hydroxydecanoyl-(acyl carrier protein) dehydratase
MSAEARLTVPAGHPAIPGHFPGRPIVPGVLLLDAVIEAARARGLRVAQVVRAKFAAPVMPGVEVEIALAEREGGRLAFTCRAGGATVLLGELACESLAAVSR